MALGDFLQSRYFRKASLLWIMTGDGQDPTSSPGPSICFLITPHLLSCLRSSTRTLPRRRVRNTSSVSWRCCPIFSIPELQAEILIWKFF
ncbi:protein disulfide isomerase family A member 6 [Rhinolophus ferrumequinum]|uniref:Protein disulfide isomerase family A member 6 n=1 Tax=Rhinolophus ferrumequinum TaxID=59479 RepID=A0A7J7V8R2_RHIFE|nr:protein disulfide isomerase family A member 6 [Rhinolophus ferrumequinum]